MSPYILYHCQNISRSNIDIILLVSYALLSYDCFGAGLMHAHNDSGTISLTGLFLLHVSFRWNAWLWIFAHQSVINIMNNYNYYYLVFYAPKKKYKCAHTNDNNIIMRSRNIRNNIIPTYTILCTNLLYVTTGRCGVYTPPACIISCRDVNPQGVA